jgi:hypothetical protein
MIFISHRINTIKELMETPTHCGVEIDLRDDLDGEIYLHHDPFKKGNYFKDFLTNFKHSLLILNIKSEGIEFEVLNLLNKHKITNYFFLDSSFPMIIKLIKLEVDNIALRYSEYENINIFKTLKDKVKWAWIDSFDNLSLKPNDYDFLKNNFKLCLVSPELQNNSDKINNFKKIINDSKFEFDAVCSKFIYYNFWISK